MQNSFDQDYFGQTTLHPLGLTAVVVLGTLLLVVPRRFAVLPMLVMACFVPPAQRIVVLGLNFDLIRFMVVFGCIRIIARGDYRGFRWNRLDFAVVAWAVSGTVFFFNLWQTSASLVYRLGAMYDIIGIYFLFRMLVRTLEDVCIIARGLAVLSVPVSVAFIFEHMTARNIFGLLGGVREFTEVRNGRLRCQGAFAHPILAGCFWAACMPLMIAQWWRGYKGKMYAVMGTVCSLVIIAMCSSATPIMAVLFGCMGAAFFPLRKSMRVVRWTLLLLLVTLHLVMKAPVWHLISRLDISGGTGYHRFLLIDGAVNHFDEWCFTGTKDTEAWGAGLHDVTNQYIAEGVNGGVVTLILFIVVISYWFGGVGRLVRACQGNKASLVLAWSLGISVLIHVTNFIGVTYFGQINMLLFLQMAIVGSLMPVGQQALRRAAMKPPISVRSGPSIVGGGNAV